MTTNILTDQLRERWQHLCKTAELLEQELEEVRRQADAYATVLADLNQQPRTATGGAGLHATIRPSQIAHCKTQRDAWVEIARLSGGFVKPSEGAQLLIDAGLTNKKRTDVGRNGSSWMAEDDRWEKADKGLYRRLEYAPDRSPDDDDGGDEWHDESLPTGDGDASLHTCQERWVTPDGRAPITA